MTTLTATAIYARISLEAEAEGDGKAIDRHVEDCTKRAHQLGWPVAEVYIDSDISAYSGKLHPQYERMVSDIEAGVIDAVFAYNMDRLTRQPKEFERCYDIVTAAGVSDVKFVTGDTDFGTDDGLYVGRIQAAGAAKESATKSRRQCGARMTRRRQPVCPTADLPDNSSSQMTGSPTTLWRPTSSARCGTAT